MFLPSCSAETTTLFVHLLYMAGCCCCMYVNYFVQQWYSQVMIWLLKIKGTALRSLFTSVILSSDFTNQESRCLPSHPHLTEDDDQQIPVKQYLALVCLFVLHVSQISVMLSSTVTKVITKQITREGRESYYETILTPCLWFILSASISWIKQEWTHRIYYILYSTIYKSNHNPEVYCWYIICPIFCVVDEADSEDTSRYIRLSSLSVCTHLISSRWSHALSLAREQVHISDPRIMTLLMLIRGTKETNGNTGMGCFVISRDVSKNIRLWWWRVSNYMDNYKI